MKNFSIFKNDKKKSDKEPDYTISMNTGTKEQPAYNTIGGCWIKSGKEDKKFISCQLSDAYGERRGWHITPDAPVNAENKVDEKVNTDDIPF